MSCQMCGHTAGPLFEHADRSCPASLGATLGLAIRLCPQIPWLGHMQWVKSTDLRFVLQGLQAVHPGGIQKLDSHTNRSLPTVSLCRFVCIRHFALPAQVHTRSNPHMCCTSRQASPIFSSSKATVVLGLHACLCMTATGLEAMACMAPWSHSMS